MAAGPTTDPIALTVNLRQVPLSELSAQMTGRPASDIVVALQEVTRRALLLQEAEHSGLGDGLPDEPLARAEAFIKRVVPSSAICRNVNRRQVAEMYAVMKPRFVHGDLYDVAELRWSCPKGFAGAACRTTSDAYAREHWRPLLPYLQSRAELIHLGEQAEGSTPVRYVEFTFHVDANGRATVPKNIAEAIMALRLNRAAITSDTKGARLHFLLDHRPPASRNLGDPGVEDEVRAELCPRLTKQGEANYLDGLTRSALLKIHREVLPKAWRDVLEKKR
jgi:hypothetical protein